MFAHETRYDIRTYTLCIVEGTSLAPSIPSVQPIMQVNSELDKLFFVEPYWMC